MQHVNAQLVRLIYLVSAVNSSVGISNQNYFNQGLTTVTPSASSVAVLIGRTHVGFDHGHEWEGLPVFEMYPLDFNLVS